MQGKERVIWGIWNGLKKPFWGRSDQSNDEMNFIPAHLCRVCDPCLIGLKTGMDFILEARSENGRLEKKTLLLVRSGGTPLTKFTKRNRRKL